MKRLYLYSAAIAALFAYSVVMSGCQAPTVAYHQQLFASLRVMNFAQSGPNCTPTAPVDVYWGTTVPTPLGNNAQIYNLSFGSSSVYSNSLFAAPNGTIYSVIVTQTRTPLKQDFPEPIKINLMPGVSYTLLVTLDPNNPSLFKDSLIVDQTPPVSNPYGNSATFVRFMNLRTGVGPLTVHVDDPVTGQLVTPASGENFFNVGPYFALNTALDTSFAFIVTNANNVVLARLSYQTFVAGGYYTLVYGGDPCNTVATNPADSSISALDTFRLHAFDDNTTGNDVTNPIQYSYRYNVINDIYPGNPAGPIYPYDPNNPNNNVIGFLVNGGGFPEHAGFSINPVAALRPGGAGVSAIAQPDVTDTVYNVNYQSAVLANPLDIKGFSTNPTGSVQRQVFDYSVQSPFSQIPQDKPVTFLFGGADTVLSTSVTGYWQTNPRILQIPDINYSDSVTFVVINGTNTTRGTISNAYFAIQSPDTVKEPPGQGSVGLAFGRIVTVRFPLSTSSPFTIRDSIGNSSSHPVASTASLTADPGGIYEVVSTGIKTDPHLLIMQVNAKNP